MAPSKRRNVIVSDEDEDDALPPPLARSEPPPATVAAANGAFEEVDDVEPPRISRRDKGKGRQVQAELEDDDMPPPSRPHISKRRKTAAPPTAAAAANAEGAYAWEAEYQRSWDVVREDEEGSLTSAVNDFIERARRRRTQRDTSSIQRGIIRHLYLILDLSLSILERDMRPSRLELTLQYVRGFISEFFDQNPISQLAIIGTRNGIAEKISSLSSNPVDHEQALKSKSRLEPAGEPSLQNALEMARLGMSHLPDHGSREALVIFSSLTTCDPTNIHATIDQLEKDRVRVNIVGLSAEISVCREICRRTKGTFSVAIDEGHYKELLHEIVPPPAAEAGGQTLGGGPAGSGGGGSSIKADLMLMGFPTMIVAKLPILCACHGRLKTNGYVCPRCKSRLCDIPTECNVCGLSVVSSPHLARSYRHLFPVQNFLEVNGPVNNPKQLSADCAGCGALFATETVMDDEPEPASGAAIGKTSSNSRYQCPKCSSHFCLECEAFIHDSLAFCVGCG